VPACFFSFLVLGGGAHRNLVNTAWLKFFGYISYGLYLIQLLIFNLYDRAAAAYWPWLQPSVGHFRLILLRFVMVSTVAIAFSYLSRKYYGDWFLRLKDRASSADLKQPAAVPQEPEPSLTAKVAARDVG
jgi:peptidoglycan/LPS O-acetylase OafA/YrhL